jgi:enamine deaminase RidA (YjgF/YER057c/UK114 family)
MNDIVKPTLMSWRRPGPKARTSAVYRIRRHFPAMTLVEVKGLYDDDCAIEIEGVAVLD